MLRFFTQRTGMRKTILLGFVAVLVLGVGIVFAIPSGRNLISSYTPISSSTTVASVDGYTISLEELRNQIRVSGMNQSMQGGRFDPSNEPNVEALYPQYGKQALDALINSRVVTREADRLGMGASKEEMRQRITSMFVGQDGRWVGEKEYQSRLRAQGLTVALFEEDIAESITEEKVRNFLTAGLTVSDQEIEQDYRRTNTTMKPTYVLVAPKQDAMTAPTDEEMRAYFAAHQADFRITDTQRKVAYVFISQEALGANLNVPDEDLQKDYDPEKYVSAVHVAQVVLKIPTPAQDGTIKKKADDITGRARGGGDKPAEDFAALAREMSEDAATKASGGDAGFIEKSSLAKDDPRERLFNAPKDQIVGPIKVGSSYAVYKVLDKRSKTFEEAKPELLAAARTRMAYSKGIELGQQAEKQLKDKKDIQTVANDLNASIGSGGAAPAVTVRETPFMVPGDQVPELGSNPQFDAELTDLKAVGDVGAVVGVNGGFAVPMVSEVREPHDATFEEVSGKIAAAVKIDRAKQVARDTATQLAAAATPADLIAKAKAAGLEPKTQENFKAGGTLPELQPSDLLDSRLLALGANSVDKTPVDMPTGFVVLACAERTEADMGAPFAGQKDSIRDRLLATKQGQFYSEYMKNVRKKLEENGQITIYQDTVDRAFDIGGLGEDEEEPADDSVPSLPPVGAPRPSAPAGKQ